MCRSGRSPPLRLSELFLHKQLVNIKIKFNTYFTVTYFTYQLNDDVHSN